MNLDKAKAFIESHHDFILAAHRSPDGDTLGSCLALRLALIALGKKADVACTDPVPPYLRFLPGSDTVLSDLCRTYEAALYIDCADHARTGSLESSLEESEARFCIDHHSTNPKQSKDGDWVEDVGATGEMIKRLITELSVTITPEIAECLYTAIATDTGNFSYSNTTPDTFRIAADILETGINLPVLNRRLFRDMPVRKGKLIGLTLRNMKLYSDESIAVALISKEMMDECEATEADCEGLIDYLRDLEPVEIACTIRESSNGIVRGSLRSKQGSDVSKAAAAFGGGGHVRAAGFSMECTLKEAEKRILPELQKAIVTWKESSMS